jgi:transposase
MVKTKGLQNQLIHNRELSKLSVTLLEPSETLPKFSQRSLNRTFLKMSNHSEDKGAKKLSIEEKASIIAYSDAGLTTKEIIVKTGRNKTTINRLLAAAKKFSDNSIPQRKKGSGRPRKVMKDVLILLKRQITKYPYMTAAQLKTSVPELAALSDRTVQHALQKDLKMRSRVAALKPMLMSQMKKKRMRFCKKYKDWTAAEWEKVMFDVERPGAS